MHPSMTKAISFYIVNTGSTAIELEYSIFGWGYPS